MRKELLSCVVSIMALTVGCQQVDPFDANNKAKDNCFSAELENARTKTTVADNLDILWHANDLFSLFVGSKTDNQCFKVGDGGGTTSAELTTQSGEAMTTGYDFNHIIAYYPYAATISFFSSDENNSLYVQLPQVQNYVANSFGAGANPTIAITSDVTSRSLSFKNICGVLKLSLTGSATVSKIVLTGNNNESLSGLARVSANLTDAPSIYIYDSSAKSIELNCGTEGVTLSNTATAFWIVTPPTEFTQGFTVKIYDNAGGVMTKSINRAVTIGRSEILPVATLACTDFVNTSVQISTPTELLAFAEAVNNNSNAATKAVLTNNLDMTGVAIPSIKAAGTALVEFDGNNKTISNLTITGSTGNKYDGLFATFKGSIHHLTLDHVTVNIPNEKSPEINCGAVLIGNLLGGTVERCTVKNAALTGTSQLGILIGCLKVADGTTTTIKNCTVEDSSISHNGFYNMVFGAGGLIGHLEATDSNVIVEGNTVTNVTINNSATFEDVGGQGEFIAWAAFCHPFVGNVLNKGTASTSYDTYSVTFTSNTVSGGNGDAGALETLEGRTTAYCGYYEAGGNATKFIINGTPQN